MFITIEQAEQLLKDDGVVALPTETVYGLAACFHRQKAIEKIYALKGRPPQNPLIVHVEHASQALSFTNTPPSHFEILTKRFWPGPLTLVIPVIDNMILPSVRAGLKTCAFRAPNHKTAQQVIHRAGPLVAPSCNLSTKPSSTLPEHIEKDFGLDFPIVEGNLPQGGVESTILIFQEDRWFLGRHGMIHKEALEEILGYPLEEKRGSKPLCPGQHFRHYAPQTKLFLTETPSKPYVVGFSDHAYTNMKKLFSLGSSASPEEVANNLYAVLRALDQEEISEADVDINIPHNGLWATILERLAKAAS